MVPLVEQEEKAEKGLLSVHTASERFAYWLSQITSPFVVGVAVFGYISLLTAPSVPDALRWLMVIGIGLAAPYGFIWWRVRKGTLADVHVSRRSQRLVPLVIGLIGLAGMLAVLLMLNASRPLIATLVAVLVSFSVATLVTQLAKYKISLHVDSAAGAMVACCLLVSPLFLALTPLVVLVAWARWKLEAHSLLQVLCGAALAITVTIITFWLFGLE